MERERHFIKALSEQSRYERFLHALRGPSRGVPLQPPIYKERHLNRWVGISRASTVPVQLGISGLQDSLGDRKPTGRQSRMPLVQPIPERACAICD